MSISSYRWEEAEPLFTNGSHNVRQRFIKNLLHFVTFVRSFLQNIPQSVPMEKMLQCGEIVWNADKFCQNNVMGGATQLSPFLLLLCCHLWIVKVKDQYSPFLEENLKLCFLPNALVSWTCKYQLTTAVWSVAPNSSPLVPPLVRAQCTTGMFYLESIAVAIFPSKTLNIYVVHSTVSLYKHLQ